MPKTPKAESIIRRNTLETTVGQVDVIVGSFELRVAPDGTFMAKLDGVELKDDIDSLVLEWQTGNLFALRVRHIIDPRVIESKEIARP